jgi:hypothetical protein
MSSDIPWYCECKEFYKAGSKACRVTYLDIEALPFLAKIFQMQGRIKSQYYCEWCADKEVVRRGTEKESPGGNISDLYSDGGRFESLLWQNCSLTLFPYFSTTRFRDCVSGYVALVSFHILSKALFTNRPIIFPSLWLCSPLYLGRFFSFLILYTVSRTP